MESVKQVLLANVSVAVVDKYFFNKKSKQPILKTRKLEYAAKPSEINATTRSTRSSNHEWV